jgi:nicotinate-nucleotide pyrophosphorylase
MARHKQHKTLDPGFVATKLEEFFSEDNAHKDITTLATQKQDQRVEAVFIAKEELVFAGSEIIRQAFCDCKIKFLENDGARVEPLLTLAPSFSKNLILQSQKAWRIISLPANTNSSLAIKTASTL